MEKRKEENFRKGVLVGGGLFKESNCFVFAVRISTSSGSLCCQLVHEMYGCYYAMCTAKHLALATWDACRRLFP